MTQTGTHAAGVTRRRLFGLAAGLAAVAAAPVYARAPGLLRGAGDIRRIRMTNPRTGEAMDAIYWIDGAYIPEVMHEISFFMRDWRENQLIAFDPRAIDIMAAAHRLMDTTEPYNVISGYRSKVTNAMLRSRNRGVASNSYHMKGMAADVRLRSRSVGQMYAAAMACHAGGVGKYTRSNFVHMDCGPVRTWGR
ncbi:MAG: hypothetical protein KatS3mg118_2996 [Paracoccaceae bacterium]|nr:MAG: DUF882 domain-containing protein [Alphaproteobacteria bacterium]GIX15037.1 MAG: hypothetical protein KatS3mg118_2996 [Paracoccaceae bacterium]